MAGLLEALGIDRARLQRISVVVTGSNGKGSTAAMCAQIGRAYGLRTGLFTSPHLFRFNERIQVDGVEIGDDAVLRLKPRSTLPSPRYRSGWQQFGAFEALFALACLHFPGERMRLRRVRGRHRRTLRYRSASSARETVTSVDYEHVKLLGNTLELIASDKSDAGAAGGTIVYGENCRACGRISSNIIAGAVARRCSSRRYPYRQRGRIGLRPTFRFQFGYHDFRHVELNLPGAFQFNNAAIAVTLFLLWTQREQPAGILTGSRPRYAPACAIRVGRPPRSHPARPAHRDRRRPHPGRHPAIAASLLAIHGAEDWILVTGASRDKKADEIVGALAPSFDTIICTAALHKGAECKASRPPHITPIPRGRSCRRVDRGGGAALAGDREAQGEVLCGGRTVPRGRICHRRERWPRGGFGIF